MNYTHAVLIVAAADRAAAQADLGTEVLNAPLSPTGAAPATHYYSGGPFDNNTLYQVVNVFTWPKRLYFGQGEHAALTSEGLTSVVDAPVGE